MFNNLTRQSLPIKEYLLLLGTALYVFNSNNSFIIENIIRTDDSYSWYNLVDKTSGKLNNEVSKTISKKLMLI